MSETEPEKTGQGGRAGEPENPHAEAVLKLADAMLRIALWPGVATVVVAAVVATVWVGLPGLLSALIGGVIAFASSLATLWMMRKTAPMPPMMVMAVALGGYIFKLLVLLGVMMALGSIHGLHREALAFTMLAVILVWAAAELVAFKRTKIPTIIPSGD
jgi:ATP synthase protein I